MVSGMSNFITLELDTTPPEIEIYAPRYVINGNYLEFRVSANEAVDTGKTIAYAVDNGQNEYPIVLEWDSENNEFIGLVDTFGFENGIAKVVVRLWDEVHNASTTEKVFKVLGNIADMDIAVKRMPMAINNVPNLTRVRLNNNSPTITLKDGDVM